MPRAKALSLALAIKAKADPSVLAEKSSHGRRDPDLIAEARERWNRCNDAESKQRQAIVNAKEFVGGDQWAQAVRIQREGGNAVAGQAPEPPKPCLTVDRLTQPLRQIQNSIKAAEFTFDVLPNTQGADTDNADLIKGFLRRIQNMARDESPVEWAAGQAAEGGIGWFQITTDFVHKTWDGEPTEEVFDQEIRLRRIANNLSVYCDPHAIKPTRRDAQFMFMTEDLDKTEFKRRWPDADVAGLEAFSASGDCPKEWVTKDSIRVADYWRIKYDKSRFFYWTKDGKIHEGKAPKGVDVRMAREMTVPRVVVSKINAFQELPKDEDGTPDAGEWLGMRIPLIPILGEELNLDGINRVRGMIEQGMDAQRIVNYMYSGAVELFALAPKSPILAAAASISQYKGIWESANRVNYAYLPWDPFDPDGKPLPEPKPTNMDRGSALQAAVQLMQVSEESIKAATNFFDASLGNLNPQQRSGTAIQSLQAQSDLATANYGDSVKRALVDAGMEIVSILPKITRPGQILHVLGDDDKPQQVMVGTPFSRGPNGQPQAAPDLQGEQLQQALQAKTHEFYDLNEGTYHVTVVMAKAQATRAQEGSQALSQLIPHLPPEMQAVATPDYVAQLNFPGAVALSEKLKNTLPPQLQDQPEGSNPLQGVVQQLQQQIVQLQQQIEGKVAEKQAEKQADFQREVKIQEMKDATSIAVARINAAKAAFDTVVEAQEERVADGVKIAHEQRMQNTAQAHDAGMAALEHHHTTAQAEQAHGHAMAAGAAAQTSKAIQQAQGHQETLEQTAQQGAITSQQQADAAQFKSEQTDSGGGQ